MDWIAARTRWLFDAEHGATDRLMPRWVFLRALGFIYFSAFFSLVFQIHGLIGPQGILPASEYLQAVAHAFGLSKGLWFAPSVLWFSSGPHMLTALCWIGMGASLLIVANRWPRLMLSLCFVCFLSFVSAAQDFSGYQSDGMLLEAGLVAIFFAPSGFRPGFGSHSPPSRASLFLLQWEWFRIYFESGVAKIMSGEEQWRHFSAMDEYYQNGPLPTWIGWYVQHLPHWFHAWSTGATLVLEWILVWMLFLPRRWRIVCFFIVTPWELGVILTANYAFLNYLVLILGILLLDDHFLLRFLPDSWKKEVVTLDLPSKDQREHAQVWSQKVKLLKMITSAVLLSWIFYATVAQLTWMVFSLPLPTSPVAALDPFRIANRYGLFGVMTRGRYEIEFQGSEDGKNWIAYPFRFKPQGPDQAPGIYAPYQPRFDWNLWFASLGSWRDYSIVPRTEEKLLSNDADVLRLFKGNPFPGKPPKEVRAVLWQYWFTSLQEKQTQGLWWRRKFLGLYAPAIERDADGSIRATEWPGAGPHQEQ